MAVSAGCRHTTPEDGGARPCASRSSSAPSRRGDCTGGRMHLKRAFCKIFRAHQSIATIRHKPRGGMAGCDRVADADKCGVRCGLDKHQPTTFLPAAGVAATYLNTPAPAPPPVPPAPTQGFWPTGSPRGSDSQQHAARPAGASSFRCCLCNRLKYHPARGSDGSGHINAAIVSERARQYRGPAPELRPRPCFR